MNFPYLGTDDGFTTYLRTKFADADYAGIELEVNQIFSNQNKMNFEIKEAIYQALEKILKNQKSSA